MQFLAELMDNGLLADSFCVTFEQGEYENRSYFIDLCIPCTEPTCNCGIVKLKAKEMSEEKGGGGGGGEEYNFYLDVLNKKNPSDKIQDVKCAEDINFSKAFTKELNESNWGELNAFYYAYKILLPNNLPTYNDIEIDFSPIETEIESTGAMVAYDEIFPLVQEITINFKEKTYIINDNFCVSSSCDCQSTLLELFDEEDLEKNDFTSRYVIYYNYETGVMEKGPRTKGTPSIINEIIGSMLQEIPGIDTLLRNRHVALRRIYDNYIARKNSAENNISKYNNQTNQIEKNNTVVIKTGRNAPCPCGSGKKYKKCCG